MGSIVTVDPFRCRVWDLHARLEGDINEDTCRIEIESFAKSGQLMPVLGRPLRGNPDFNTELIYGARRLFVARHLNVPLQVELREMTDREAIVVMEIENRHRKDLSPYERGMGYARWLRSGLFRSQDELARALKISPAQVSRLLRLARLPSVIVDAFGSAVVISEAWGLSLLKVLDEPESREAIIRSARAICAVSPRPQSREVYRQLLSASAGGRRVKASGRDQVVTAHNGSPLFRIRHKNNSITLILPLERVSAAHLKSIRVAVASILQSTKTTDPEVTTEFTNDWRALDGRRHESTQFRALV